MNKIDLSVKGHSGGNVGAWACVLSMGETHKTLRGTADNASHNQMEIEACIQGLSAITRPCAVTIYTNSTYLQGGIALLASGTHYDTNILTWQRFLNAAERHTIECVHTPKAQNSGYMRLADSLALNLIPPQYRRGA